MTQFAHHTVSSVLAIHEEVRAAHGGLAGVKDLGLLESAIAAPQASFGGQPLVQDPTEIAASRISKADLTTRLKNLLTNSP
jgi:death-on-curing protein